MASRAAVAPAFAALFAKCRAAPPLALPLPLGLNVTSRAAVGLLGVRRAWPRAMWRSCAAVVPVAVSAAARLPPASAMAIGLEVWNIFRRFVAVMDYVVMSYKYMCGDSLCELLDTVSVYELTDGQQNMAVGTDVGGWYVLLIMVLVCVWLVKKKSRRG